MSCAPCSTLRHDLLFRKEVRSARCGAEHRFIVEQKGEPSMPSTIRLHRVLRARPERVYSAFLDPDAMAKWLPPNGFTGKVHQMDARVGGTFRMSFTNFASGAS